MEDDTPEAGCFARARNPVKETVGVKWECPVEIVMMLDAECADRARQQGVHHVDRGPVLNDILGKWAKDLAHGVMVKHSVMQGNSQALDSLLGREG
jgi:hypothetical protein